MFHTKMGGQKCMYATADEAGAALAVGDCDALPEGAVTHFASKHQKNPKKGKDTMMNQQGVVSDFQTEGGNCINVYKFKKVSGKPLPVTLEACDSKKKWKKQRLAFFQGRISLEYKQDICLMVPFKDDDNAVYFRKCQSNLVH